MAPKRKSGVPHPGANDKNSGLWPQFTDPALLSVGDHIIVSRLDLIASKLDFIIKLLDDQRDNAPTGKSFTLIKTTYFDAISTVFNKWLEDTGEKPYKARTKGLTEAVDRFLEHLVQRDWTDIVEDYSPDHELATSLAGLNAEQARELYLKLGQTIKPQPDSHKQKKQKKTKRSDASESESNMEASRASPDKELGTSTGLAAGGRHLKRRRVVVEDSE